MRRVILWVGCCLITALSWAGPQEDAALKAVQDKFKTTFTNMPVVDFAPGPIKGLYEMNINGNIVYYSAESELLFFGEIYDKFGKSLTAEKKALISQQRIGALPLDKALVIGPTDGIPIIEFTDPDCPYCRAYSQYIQERSGPKVKRMIFFFTRIHPDAAKKAEHILCSKDREKAFADVFVGKEFKWKECNEGKELLAFHAQASKDIGLQGTPSFALDGTLVTGFKRNAIDSYLSQRSQHPQK